MDSDDQIERAIARAQSHAGPTMAANFIHPDWVMSAAEFRTFWSGERLAAVSTVGAQANPHCAPIEVRRQGDRFVVPSFANAVRLVDLRFNPAIVLTTWDDAWHCAIVYGRAEVPDGSSGMVPVTVLPTRIHAIRAPTGHHAHRFDPAFTAPAATTI